MLYNQHPVVRPVFHTRPSEGGTDIEQAYTDAISAFEKYRSTTKAVIANQEAHRYALEKYAAGKSTVFEYNEIKMKLADALSQQSQAKYTYLLKDRILAFYSCFSLTD